MKKEILRSKRGTPLRKNGSRELILLIEPENYENIFLINGTSFLTNNISRTNLKIKPNDFFMIINNSSKKINIKYNEDISSFRVIYDPYKYEKAEKKNLKLEFFKKNYDIPDNYIDTLPKWYSFKFTYPDYNLIFIKPEMGISIQTHKYRSENWKIIGGNPIIINGNKVHYFVEKGSKFFNPVNSYHSIINPNKKPNKFVIIEERWNGDFDEKDIERVYNPN
ncbi:MAG: hypothetical protein ACTSQJ_06240, partial [Promethearchaeota archaeon]